MFLTDKIMESFKEQCMFVRCCVCVLEGGNVNLLQTVICFSTKVNLKFIYNHFNSFKLISVIKTVTYTLQQINLKTFRPLHCHLGCTVYIAVYILAVFPIKP